MSEPRDAREQDRRTLLDLIPNGAQALVAISMSDDGEYALLTYPDGRVQVATREGDTWTLRTVGQR